MREVVYLIKNLTPVVAIDRLPFTGKKAAIVLRKVILTAVANAKQQGVNPDELIFKEIQINEGPRLKRFQAGARGRAKPYKKRMSHIRVVLTTKPVLKSLPVQPESKKAAQESVEIKKTVVTKKKDKDSKKEK
jgi:large subunit ribosomal protein L22